MIEYVPEEGSASDYNPGDEFSDETPAPKAEKPAAKPASKAKAKPAADDMDDDIPF
jgi:hypothetical protein